MKLDGISLIESHLNIIRNWIERLLNNLRVSFERTESLNIKRFTVTKGLRNHSLKMFGINCNFWHLFSLLGFFLSKFRKFASFLSLPQSLLAFYSKLTYWNCQKWLHPTTSSTCYQYHKSQMDYTFLWLIANLTYSQ